MIATIDKMECSSEEDNCRMPRERKEGYLDQAIGGFNNESGNSNDNIWSNLVKRVDNFEDEVKNGVRINRKNDSKKNVFFDKKINLCSDNSEDEAIKVNCEYVSKFFKDLVSRDISKMSKNSKTYVEEMMEGLEKLELRKPPKCEDEKKQESNTSPNRQYLKKGATPKLKREQKMLTNSSSEVSSHTDSENLL